MTRLMITATMNMKLCIMRMINLMRRKMNMEEGMIKLRSMMKKVAYSA